MAGINCYEDVVRIIRYVVIGISWCCALLNVLVIIMEKMAKRSFDNILMQVQITYVVLCSAILTYYPGLDKTYHCQLQAYIYYASWFVNYCDNVDCKLSHLSAAGQYHQVAEAAN